MNTEIKTLTESADKAAEIVIAPVKQRMANPFVGSFVLSFVVLNWRPITYFLISDKTIEEKFIFITSNYYSDQWEGWLSWCMYLFFPILIAIVYLALIPLLTDYIEKFVHFTILNKSRREHLVNLKARRNLEYIAWADFKTEEARSGYVDRRKLNQGLDDLKKQLQVEKETVKVLNGKNLELSEQIIKFSSDIKESEVEFESIKKDLDRSNKAVKDSENTISNLLKEISGHEESIDKLQNELNEKTSNMNSKDMEIASLKRSLSESQNDLIVLREDLEGLQSSLQILNEDYKNLTKILTEKDETINELVIEKTSLEDSNYQLNAEIRSLQSNLNQFSDFELHIPEFPEAMRKISGRFPELPIENYQYFNGQPMPEMVNVISRFMIDLKKIAENTPKISPNYYVRIRKEENISDVEAINLLFKESQNFMIYILGLNIDSSGFYHINIQSKDEIHVHDLFGFGPEIWQMNTLEILIDSQQ